jgi:hypothetical protein
VCLIGGTVANWLVAVGTLVLAAVAVFQETIRGWFYHPEFQTSLKTEPPDCVSVPFTRQDGAFIANSIYLRLWVENVGNAAARNVEVYAQELRRQRADRTWARVVEFPPMNLKWANLGGIYFPIIAPNMDKHHQANDRDIFAGYMEPGRNDNVARWRGRNHAHPALPRGIMGHRQEA